jgi:hypothetical protein
MQEDRGSANSQPPSTAARDPPPALEERRVTDEQPQIVVPVTCEKHRYDLLVTRLHLGPNDPRLVQEVTLQILLFRQLAADPRIAARCTQTDGKAEAKDLSLVLGELGCMACYEPRYYRRACAVIEKGFPHASLVARGFAADLPHFPQLLNEDGSPREISK